MMVFNKGRSLCIGGQAGKTQQVFQAEGAAYAKALWFIPGIVVAGSDGESSTRKGCRTWQGPAHRGKACFCLALPPPYSLYLAHSYPSFRSQLRDFLFRKPFLSYVG